MIGRHTRRGLLLTDLLVIGGQVLVGTDRIKAFGLGQHHVVHPSATHAVAFRPAVPITSTPDATPSSSGLDGKAIHQQRCAQCHDHPQGSIPPRAFIASRPHAEVIEAMTHGVMRTQAAGLSAQDVEAVAGALK
jgi:cytochrome c553